MLACLVKDMSLDPSAMRPPAQRRRGAPAERRESKSWASVLLPEESYVARDGELSRSRLSFIGPLQSDLMSSGGAYVGEEAAASMLAIQWRRQAQVRREAEGPRGQGAKGPGTGPEGGRGRTAARQEADSHVQDAGRVHPDGSREALREAALAREAARTVPIAHTRTIAIAHGLAVAIAHALLYAVAIAYGLRVAATQRKAACSAGQPSKFSTPPWCLPARGESVVCAAAWLQLVGTHAKPAAKLDPTSGSLSHGAGYHGHALTNGRAREPVPVVCPYTVYHESVP